MSKIETTFSDIHGYTKPIDGGIEVGGIIAEVDMGEEKRIYRLGCIYKIAKKCPLQSGIQKGGMCDADNYQGRDRNEIEWSPPGNAVGCGRTGIILAHPPDNIDKFIHNP